LAAAGHNRKDPARARPSRPIDVRRRRAARVAVLAVIVVAAAGSALFSRAEEPTAPAGGSGAPDLPEAACKATRPPQARPQRYESPPLALKAGADYGAVISTSCGDITIDLAEGKAPENVNSFVFLARRGFYDGLIWHRVVPNSIIQSGDPNGVPGEPPEGPGYTVPDEYPVQGSVYVRGVVAMANKGPFTDSAGSQFFIVTHKGISEDVAVEPAGLEPHYSIIGRVARTSFDVLDEIGEKETRGSGAPGEANTPIVPIYIESIRVTETRG